jgi:DNA-binding phage protein
MCCANMAKARWETEAMTDGDFDHSKEPQLAFDSERILTMAIEYYHITDFQKVLSEVVCAFGIGKLSDSTGFSRQKITRAIRPAANPRFETVLAILRGMGFAVSFVPTTKQQTS